MHTENPYESETYLAQYLLFHYGSGEEILPYSFGPLDALHFPVRSVMECLDSARLPAQARALDLGCAVGRSSFELARFCVSVVGLDRSHRFIQTATTLAEHGWIEYRRIEEGRLTTPLVARVPADLERQRVTFTVGDAMQLPRSLGRFDVVLMANLIDRLSNPTQCLAQLADLLTPGGQLIITSPYTWLEAFTPKDNWLGGFERHGGKVMTLATLQDFLAPQFALRGVKDLPFLIREHARKYQWSVAQASLWIRTGHASVPH